MFVWGGGGGFVLGASFFKRWSEELVTVAVAVAAVPFERRR